MSTPLLLTAASFPGFCRHVKQVRLSGALVVVFLRHLVSGSHADGESLCYAPHWAGGTSLVQVQTLQGTLPNTRPGKGTSRASLSPSGVAHQTV